MTPNRRNRGSALAETGPALFFLLILTIFPCMTLLGIGAQYAFAWYHNHLVVEELAQRRAVDGGGSNPVYPNKVTVNPAQFRASAVGQQIKTGFDDQGLGKFIGVQLINDTITYFPANPNNAAQTNRLEARTTLTGRPFICIPIINFNSMNFSLTGEAIREVTQ
jgi:hypothetical protein